MRSRLQQSRQSLIRRYRQITVLGVVSAGLVDGINPCAFAVLLFFVAYLSYLGRSRAQIAAAGLTFTAVVFVTYFAIGLGLFRALELTERWSSVAQRLLYGATAVLLLVAAGLSFRDAVLARRGQTEGMALSLPQWLRSRIRLTISSRARMGLTLGTTAVLGAAVAAFEFPCTGQVYVPILFALRNLPGEWQRALPFLALYNLCFIVPLVAVFVAVWRGVSSERLTALFRRHLASAKVALGLVFLALAAIMVGYVRTAGG